MKTLKAHIEMYLENLEENIIEHFKENFKIDLQLSLYIYSLTKNKDFRIKVIASVDNTKIDYITDINNLMCYNSFSLSLMKKIQNINNECEDFLLLKEMIQEDYKINYKENIDIFLKRKYLNIEKVLYAKLTIKFTNIVFDYIVKYEILKNTLDCIEMLNEKIEKRKVMLMQKGLLTEE